MPNSCFFPLSKGRKGERSESRSDDAYFFALPENTAGTETVFLSEDYFYFFSLLERQAGKEETAGEKHGKPLRCCVFFFLLVDFVAAHDKNLLTCYLFFI